MEGLQVIQGGQRNRSESEFTEKQAFIYGESRLARQRSMWDHKVYNREDMNVNLGLDYEPNNLDREIDPDVTIREFKNHKKKSRVDQEGGYAILSVPRAWAR